MSHRISKCNTISLSFLSSSSGREFLIRFRIIDELIFGISSPSGFGMNLIVEEGLFVRWQIQTLEADFNDSLKISSIIRSIKPGSNSELVNFFSD